ncbi:MAG: alpha/beta hydrolase [Robiginitalea sp.]
MEAVSIERFSGMWDGIHVHGYWHTPAGPAGLVVLVHGFGEHSERYLDGVVPFFTSRGLCCFGFDLIGHGRSGGKRGDCTGYDQLLHFVGTACRLARERHPGLPLLLFGHSMGGNLVLNFALRRMGQPEGIVASSPYLRLAFRPPKWKWQLGKFLERVAPHVTVPAGLDPNGISRDPREVAAYQKDPLIHDRISPRYSFPVIEAGEWALENASDLKTPILILHGTDDPIIDPQGSRIFHQKNPGSRLVEIEGGFHELHHDLERAAYFEALQGWLSANFPFGTAAED